ncbi:radical SAM protein [Pleomorphomonas sp. PLEO]|uniref:radical SAM protein n=1 Tax=Pleomorphomonas sp. PLEO TaxID=3239306 RepID=UPI00351E6481
MSDPGISSSACAAHGMRQAAMQPAFPDLEGKHPCFSTTAEGHAKAARLHLPVSPLCNIACAFCRRDFNRVEHRPGVAARLLKPAEAVEVVDRAVRLIPNLSVVGIAGPGDPLASDHAIETFAQIHARWPDLTLCVSTNGLQLPARVDDLKAAGVTTLTVTVNSVDPDIQATITPKLAWERKRIDGVAAGKRLIDSQLKGIARAAELGFTIKINTVLIPTINDHHIGDIARTVAAAGARMINIIPLIPEHQLKHLKEPGFVERHKARAAAAQHLKVFTHCQRCRADAAGVPGLTDYTAELYGDDLQTEPTFSHG